MYLLSLCQGMAPAFFCFRERRAENVRGIRAPGVSGLGLRGVLVTDQGGYQRMSVLMGIQGGIQNKKFIPAACAQWGGIRHTGLFTAATRAAVGRPYAGIPAFLRPFCAALRVSWPCVLPFLPSGRGRRQDMKMRFRKTPAGQRVSYCYESVTGEKFRISAEEYGAETVSLLHRMDDSEVRNNISAGKQGIATVLNNEGILSPKE